jgi:hypothetical protein
MVEKKSDEDRLRETVSRDVGSFESRAAEKMLESKMPVLIAEYWTPGPRDEQGRQITPPTCNSPTAKVRTPDGSEKILTRNDGETDAEFRERAIQDTPAFGFGFVTMCGDADE